MPDSVARAAERLISTAKALELISPLDLALERDLHERKWFAYRFMSPLDATLEFGRIYQEKLKDYVRTNIDLEQSRRMADFDGRLPAVPDRHFTHLWKARQYADQFPIPYTTYLTFCFEFAESRQRRMAPRPNQLRPNTKTMIAWNEKFEQYLERQEDHFLRVADLPAQFRIEHYRSLSAQDDLRSFIRGMMRTYPRALHFDIELWSDTKRILPRSFFATFNSEEAMKTAEALIQSDREAGRIIDTPTPKVPLVEEDFWPSCYGVPYAHDPYVPSCVSCQFKTACAETSRHLIANHGAHSDVEDADAERKRRMTRERVKRHRDLKKNPLLRLTKDAANKYRRGGAKPKRGRRHHVTQPRTGLLLFPRS